MFEGIGLIIIGLAALVSFVALFMVAGVFFPAIVARSQSAVEENFPRAFWLGFVNTLALAIVVAVFAFLGERMANFLFIPGILLLVFYLPSALFGLIALGRVVGERLFPQAALFRQQAFGSGMMILAALFPFLGWYILTPFLLSLGFGAFLLAAFQRRAADPELENLD